MKFQLLLTTLAILANHAVGANYDNRHLLLDQSLNPSDAAASPYLFTEVKEALSAINGLQLTSTDTITLEIAPGVYWVDDPDDPAIRRIAGNSQGTPYGFQLHASHLRLVGLSDKAEDVVLACNRGQTQGALGNFTMFFMDCQSIEAQNITFGNYCSVDLEYPRNPLLNRPRRAKAIVQAQLIHTNAKWVEASNCRFISRLNLCPFSGVYRALFTDCHFECTDDALEGSAIYHRCHFEFFSNKPFWGTPNHGPVFLDCDIDTHVKGVQYFMKTRGGLSLIHTRIHQLEHQPLTLVAAYGQNDASCYYSDVTVNGQPAQIDGATDITHLPLLSAFSVENLLQGPQPTYMKCDKDLHLSFYCWNGEPAKIRTDNDITVAFVHPYGLTARTQIHQKAQLEEAPGFVQFPTLRYSKKEQTLQVEYQLDSPATDDSEILWYKTTPDGKRIKVKRATRSYSLSAADQGCSIEAEVTPKTQISVAGKPASAPSHSHNRKTSTPKNLKTDFHDIPVGYQPHLVKGCWTFDAHKPADTQTYHWEAQPQNGWYYGQGVDGAAHHTGLVQATRGARCFYLPAFDACKGMSATLQIAPAKTAGQGFGSATGQYMDIGIGFDPVSLTGYALRVQRTPDYDRAVVLQLIEYRNGTVSPISDSQVFTGYLTTCQISVSLQGSKLNAAATHDDKTIRLETTIANIHDLSPAFYLQHTGSTGPSASLIESVHLTWD